LREFPAVACASASSVGFQVEELFCEKIFCRWFVFVGCVCAFAGDGLRVRMRNF
jgi:hypothetical protein